MAKPEDLDLAEGEGKAGGKKSSKVLLITLIVLLSIVVLGGAVVGTMWATGFFDAKHATDGEQVDGEEGDAEEEPEEEKERQPAVYIPLDPPFVVNFDGQGKARFLQVSVELMGRDEEMIKSAEHHLPAIRNKLVLLFSSQTYDKVSTIEGKDMLRGEALEAIRGILEAEVGEPVVEDVYFTSFVMQ